MKWLIWIAVLTCGPTITTHCEAAPKTCTAQMKARGYKTQADAKAFGRKCLKEQGAVAVTLKPSDVMTLLQPIIGDDHPLTSLVPSDVATFCPKYPTMDRAGRALMWRTMLIAMAKPESNYKAAEPYWEVNQNQYSLGLLQLSLSDEKRYQCGLTNEVDLTRPEINLSCATKIITKWVTADGIIGGDPAHLKLGGGRYWSTLRERKVTSPGAPPADARDEIIAAVRAVPNCA